MQKKDKTRIIILAAGKGTRMKSELPKVLVPLMGKPMIKHLLESIHKSGIDDKPVIVVGYGKEKVIKELGKNYDYVPQSEQLGTGHAVLVTSTLLENKFENIVVLYSDNPFISSKTIKGVIKKHKDSKATITFTTTKLADFKDWRSAFFHFGRILRKNGKVVGICEYKDSLEKQRKIKELNAGCYVFKADWLWKNLKKIKNKNIQKEYYLIDLIDIAKENGKKIETITINPREALGVNSKEELEILEKFAPEN